MWLIGESLRSLDCWRRWFEWVENHKLKIEMIYYRGHKVAQWAALRLLHIRKKKSCELDSLDYKTGQEPFWFPPASSQSRNLQLMSLNVCMISCFWRSSFFSPCVAEQDGKYIRRCVSCTMGKWCQCLVLTLNDTVDPISAVSAVQCLAAVSWWVALMDCALPLLVIDLPLDCFCSPCFQAVISAVFTKWSSCYFLFKSLIVVLKRFAEFILFISAQVPTCYCLLIQFWSTCVMLMPLSSFSLSLFIFSILVMLPEISSLPIVLHCSAFFSCSVLSKKKK